MSNAPVTKKYHSTWIARNAHYVHRADGTVDRVERPVIVCLCGSTRFYEFYQRANYELTMAGNIVLSVGHYPHAPGAAHGETVGCTAEQKVALDELHKRKIDLADEVFVLNVGGYVGDSTRSEILYALSRNRPVRYLEPDKAHWVFRPELATQEVPRAD